MEIHVAREDIVTRARSAGHAPADSRLINTPFSSRRTLKLHKLTLAGQRHLALLGGVLAFCSLLCPSLASNVLDDFSGQLCIMYTLGILF